VQPALETDYRQSFERPEQKATSVTGRRCGGPSGKVSKRDRDRFVKLIRQSAQAGAEHDAQFGDQVGPFANGILERIKPD
jgi:hypothetical protein